MQTRALGLLPFIMTWALAPVSLGELPQGAPKSLPTRNLQPSPDSHGVCPDVQLRIHFSQKPEVGSGRIQILDAADDSVVETIDTDKATATKRIGGFPNFNYYPILMDGNDALVSPAKPLGYGKTYKVVLDAGVFKDAGGAYGGISGDAWRFTTSDAPPPAGATKVTVAADGSGDFATVQGAIDWVPEGNTTPRTIFIKNGVYHEIVCFTNRHALTFQGEDRKKTIIEYPNNDRFNNNANGNPFGNGANPSTMPARTGSVYRRGMFLAHRVNDLTITNLTLHNTTPQGGSQAEAIILNGTPNARAVLRDVDLYSFQDTLQINGQAYIRDCYIEGDVDFMWGTGPCFFEDCHARSLRSNAYYTQIRNPPTNHGYVFKHCTFDGAAGVTGNFLARIDPVRFPASEVVMIDCAMTDAVGPAAWRLDQPAARGRGAAGPAAAPATLPADARVHFWEYNSHTPDGKPVDVSRRLPAARVLKLPDDKQLIDEYGDPKFVLGGQWSPTAAGRK